LEFIGCAGIRKFKDNIAELKRMYIKPGYRGVGLGNKLLEIALLRAKELDYSKIYLDTLSSMKSAVKIYKTAGFKEIKPYRFNPSEDALFFEKVI
jgi:ribosomal protein S18 acetylase RimI-like enzyme